MLCNYFHLLHKCENWGKILPLTAEIERSGYIYYRYMVEYLKKEKDDRILHSSDDKDTEMRIYTNKYYHNFNVGQRSTTKHANIISTYHLHLHTSVKC